MSESNNNIDDGGLAFPNDGGDGSVGMSLLDYFAGQALAGMLARDDLYADVAARDAYSFATHMLKERERFTSDQR